MGTSTMLFCWSKEGGAPWLTSFAELDGRHCWPSKAFIDHAGELFVGPAAQRRFNQAPEGGIMLPSAKRYFRYGREQLDPANLPTRLQERPWPSPDELGEHWRSPQDVLDAFIAEGIRAAASEEGIEEWEELAGCLGVPAEWDETARMRIAQLAGSAGIDTGQLTRIKDEPVLAASAYFTLASRPEPGNYIAYDLGGGSFDAAWVEYQGPGEALRVSASLGDLHLGGDDVDAGIAALIEWKIAEATGENVLELRDYLRSPDGRGVAARWDERAEEAKRRLGRAEEVSLRPLELALELLPIPGDHHEEIVISRQEMVEIISPLIAETKRTLDRLSRQWSAHQPDCRTNVTIDSVASELSGIILVGGMTQMPLLRELLQSAIPDVTWLKAPIMPAEELVAWGTSLDDKLVVLNTHRLCYDVKIVFEDASGAYCGSDTLLQRYEAGYQWQDTVLTGKIPARREIIRVPPPAHRAKLVYVRQDGQSTEEELYTDISRGKMERLEQIPIADAQMQMQLDACGMITLFPGNEHELLPRSMPWLSGAARKEIERRIEDKRQAWEKRMEEVKTIETAYE